MDIKKALREEIAQLDEKVEALQAKRKPLVEALEALGGAVRKRRPPAHRTLRDAMVSTKERQTQLLALLERHPGHEYSPQDAATELDAPYSSMYKAAERLVERGEAVRVGTTPRGAPRVRLADQSSSTPDPKPPARDGSPSAPPATDNGAGGERTPRPVRERTVLDVLRRSACTWTVPQLADDLGWTQGTTYRVLGPLVKAGRVKAVTRKPLVVQHRPVTVRPGEGVAANG